MPVRRQNEVKLNWVDKLVTFFDPKKGHERLYHRTMLALSGGYTGASKNRRSMKDWMTTGGSADADLLPDLQALRERSRDLIRNNPLATGAINTKVTNVVGTGLRLQAGVNAEFLGMSEEEADAWEKEVEREFNLWASKQDCDIERTLNFYGQQELAFRSTLENGDCFFLLPFLERQGDVYGTKIQLIEADRVSNQRRQPDSETLAGGVEKDGNGAPVAYHILKHHPGAILREAEEWVRVEAFGRETGRRVVHHLFAKKRVAQTRGIPDLAPVIEHLKQLGQYAEAELMAAVVSGMFTVFVKTEADSGLGPMTPGEETGGKSDDDDYKLGPGAIVEMGTDEDISTANPGRPNANFDPFVLAILRQVGVALELPFEILIKHFTASYSAARAALIEAWKFFLNRREWLAANFCQPIYEAWLTEAVARGRVYAPGFLDGDPAIRDAYLRAQWIGPARGQIDELKEIKAAKERVNLTISTLEEETAQLTGGDWERKYRQRSKEIKLLREAGLAPPLMPENGEKNAQSNEDSDVESEK